MNDKESAVWFLQEREIINVYNSTENLGFHVFPED
jgi:hypothetical protein